MNPNIKITHDELKLIRSLSDFDLTMLLSEIEDHGWNQARALIPMIARATSEGAA